MGAEMESVFSRFDSYEFEADRRFQEGLRTLRKCHSEMLDVKLFYYNRFVEPIDQISYKQQRSASSRLTLTDNAFEHPTPTTPSDSDLDVSDQTTETSAETKQLSFAEVMRLVQEGKEVPGVTKLDVQPANQSPAPSQMQRRLKPWETASVAK